MDDKKLIEDLYNVTRPWFVSRVVLDPDEKILHAYLEHDDGCRWQCPECHREYCISDHVRERVWRDLDSGIYHVYLHARIPRIECMEHGKLQVSLPWSDRHSRFSMRFENLAMEMMKGMDILNASVILGISWFQAHGIMRRAVERGLSRKSSSPVRIGIDEKSYGKHHRYMTVVYDLDKNVVDHIESGRKKESLDMYYTKIGKDAVSKIMAVSMDMWDPFIASTRSNIMDADSRIVFDRFHIMKHMNSAVDQVRNIESRNAESREMLKKTRYLWLYSSENLPDKYKEKYEILKTSDLKTARAYGIKENLRNLWKCNTEEEASSFWKMWHHWASHSHLGPVERVAKMIKHYLYGIMSYFHHHITNAIAEGLNSKIATVQKMAYGYRNQENLKTAIYFHCGNLDVSF